METKARNKLPSPQGDQSADCCTACKAQCEEGEILALALFLFHDQNSTYQIHLHLTKWAELL